MKPDNEADLTNVFPLGRSGMASPQGGDATLPMVPHTHTWHIETGKAGEQQIVIRYCRECAESYILVHEFNNLYTWRRIEQE